MKRSKETIIKSITSNVNSKILFQGAIREEGKIMLYQYTSGFIYITGDFLEWETGFHLHKIYNSSQYIYLKKDSFNAFILSDKITRLVHKYIKQ